METKRSMARLWELAESEHGRLIRSVLSAVFGVICGMLPYFAAARMISGLFSGNRQIQFYAAWCLLAFAGYTARAVFYALALSMSHNGTFSVLKHIREQILKKLPNMPLGTVMDISSGKMKQIIVDQVESMERPLAHLLPEMTSSLMGPVFILIYLLILDWRMALLSLVSIPAGMIFMGTVMKDYGEKYEGAVKTSQRMNAAIVEYIGGIEVIKAFNQGRNSYGRYADSILANASYYYNWMKSCQLPMSIAKAVLPTTLITILPAGWAWYVTGSLSAETFLTVIILSLGVAGPLIAVMNFIDDLAKAGTIVDSVDSILKGEEQIHKDQPIPWPDSDICADHVSFGYHEGEEVLHDVSLRIAAGQLTAFVGPSGSGKSTIAKLIGGFWDVKKGKISIGGVSLQDIPLSEIYDHIAFVSQDNYLFDETIRDNIRMGKMSASDQEVEEAAKAAGCDEFIRSLEQGYDTKVGEGGAHLSGGERQRISIARAMLKDAPVVILDEATAYIDPENEAVIQNAVARLVEGKTVIVIAHRLSTITDADRIYVIRHGRVDACGTHEQLLKESSLYESMWKAHIGVKEGEKL